MGDFNEKIFKIESANNDYTLTEAENKNLIIGSNYECTNPLTKVDAMRR